MSWLSSLFKGGKNPANAAMPFLNQIPNMARQYHEPFINRGNEAYNVMREPLSQMSQDPAAFIEALMQHYEPSRGYGLKRDEALRAAGNTAAAAGQRGSMSDIGSQARIAEMLMGEDMQQWLQNVLGVQGAGLTGEQNLYNLGYGASTGLSGDLSNVLGTQASLAFQGQSEKNKRMNDMLSGLLKAAGTIGTAFI